MWRQKGERKDRTSLLPSGMKMVGNGRENPQTVIVLVLFWPGTGAGMGKTDGKTNSILRDIGNGNYGSGTYQLRWENINYGREHDTCNHFKHLARHHVYITLTHHQVDNTVQAAQVRNKEKNTTWAARQQQPVADSGGRRSTPVAWISDLSAAAPALPSSSQPPPMDPRPQRRRRPRNIWDGGFGGFSRLGSRW